MKIGIYILTTADHRRLHLTEWNKSEAPRIAIANSEAVKIAGRKYNIEKITKAYEYAKQLHEGQYRKSGEEYICHPVAVAEIVAGLELDTDSICAALLHDTLEDCADKIDIEKIKKDFCWRD